MPYYDLKDEPIGKPLIFIFTEGTILKHSSLLKILDFKSYLPIDECVSVIRTWYDQGAGIVYCTSLKGKKASITKDNLLKYGFVGSRLYYRNKKQSYADLVEEVKPDIVIEDDCKSIGGEKEWCITKVRQELKEQITSVIVPEFLGLGHLPTDMKKLLTKKDDFKEG